MSNYLYYNHEISKICCVNNDKIEYLNYPSISFYLNQLCIQNGSTLQGRKDAYQIIMKQRKYIPIIISLHPSCIYFPISSIKDSECIWIHYEEIQSVEYKEKTCIIQFKDSTRLTCLHKTRILNTLQAIQKYLLITS